MERYSTIFTTLLVAVGLNCLPTTAKAEHSLYDAHSAKLLDKHFTHLEFSAHYKFHSPVGKKDLKKNKDLQKRSLVHSAIETKNEGIAKNESEPKSLLSGVSYYFGPKSANIRYDKRMVEAAQIAAQRARTHSTSRCWHAVKNALVEAHVVDSRPVTQYAKEAAGELSEKYGFRKTSIKDPFCAPVGSVLVYGGRGAGHVEIRTATGFVSDFTSTTPSNRPLIGVFIKSS